MRWIKTGDIIFVPFNTTGAIAQPASGTGQRVGGDIQHTNTAEVFKTEVINQHRGTAADINDGRIQRQQKLWIICIDNTGSVTYQLTSCGDLSL